jgi:hypothetical protein
MDVVSALVNRYWFDKSTADTVVFYRNAAAMYSKSRVLIDGNRACWILIAADKMELFCDGIANE